jgi:hypothetical protein
MHTPKLDPKLQAAIRAHFTDANRWPNLAADLGVTLKSVQYQLNPALGREVTYHFVGLIAAKIPYSWAAIQEEK